ncbi:efflux transporter outer membrane subunit [Sphingomonas ginkgonis]|uniref:Efflux transporter outer membrane subunit n=2 Tax=Sphingomonas ginkgonis TaxID=2315330 RepID=A0A429VDL6_9SPHN|nr:efflux transporter outer membrane subunit [Sphingomonas ginkgonis]
MRRLAPFVMLAAAGCATLEPTLNQPALPVPASWPVGDPYLRSSEATLPAVTYAQLFVDPGLQTLIAQGLRNSRDLRTALYNVEAARAQVRITRANQLPEVTSSGSARESFNGGSRASGGGFQSSFGANVGVSYDLDLFGRLRSLTRSDQDRLFATAAAARATRLALVGQIAQAWAEYAADSTLLAISEQTVAIAQDSVRITNLRLRGGIAPRTDLLQAQQVLETARADAALQRTNRAQDINLLQLLVGAPIDVRLLQNSIADANRTLVPLPAGLDSRVLLRRPDVLQAEYNLRAANAQIGAARAALFPDISLTGLLGLASTALTGLFSGSAFSASAGAGITYPIFNAGATRARVRQTEAQRQALLSSYEQAIQSAFREVADALATQGTIGERQRASRANVGASAETLRLVQARYRGGIDPFLNVLDAQRSYYTAQRSQVAVQLAAATNTVDLYRALGADSSLELIPIEPGR